MGLCKCLWPSFPLLSHVCRLAPQLDLLGQVQGCSGNVLWGLNLEYATGHNNPMPATPANLGTSSLVVKEVWALWNLFSGQLVSFSLAVTHLNKNIFRVLRLMNADGIGGRALPAYCGLHRLEI